MINLESKHLETVKAILAQYVPDAEVRAFGSRVNGNAKSYSDLDLAIMSERKLGLMEMAGIESAFEESDLPIRVDVLDWQTISKTFKEVINNNFEVLKEKAIAE